MGEVGKKNKRMEGWHRRRGKRVHCTNVGRQGQSREHLFLESINPPSTLPFSKPPLLFFKQHLFPRACTFFFSSLFVSTPH